LIAVGKFKFLSGHVAVMLPFHQVLILISVPCFLRGARWGGFSL